MSQHTVNGKQFAFATMSDVLSLVAKGKMTPEEAAIALEIIAKTDEIAITFKIGAKGGMSVYGLGRNPTTLYVNQWERLLADDTVLAAREFLAKHADALDRKTDSDEVKAKKALHPLRVAAAAKATKAAAAAESVSA